MKKIALFFLVILFLVSCNLRNIDLEMVPTSSSIEKTEEGIIADVGEALMGGSIKGMVIVWQKPVPVTPEISSDVWFVYSKDLSGLKGRKVRITFVYEDEGYVGYGNRRIHVPIVRLITITDLGTGRNLGPVLFLVLFFKSYN